MASNDHMFIFFPVVGRYWRTHPLPHPSLVRVAILPQKWSNDMTIPSQSTLGHWGWLYSFYYVAVCHSMMIVKLYRIVRTYGPSLHYASHVGQRTYHPVPRTCLISCYISIHVSDIRPNRPWIIRGYEVPRQVRIVYSKVQVGSNQVRGGSMVSQVRPRRMLFRHWLPTEQLRMHS